MSTPQRIRRSVSQWREIMTRFSESGQAAGLGPDERLDVKPEVRPASRKLARHSETACHFVLGFIPGSVTVSFHQSACAACRIASAAH